MQYRPVLATTGRYRFASLQPAHRPLQIRWFLYAVPAGTGHYRPVPFCRPAARAPPAPNTLVFICSTGRYWPLLISTALPARGSRSTRSKYAGFDMQYRPVLATTDQYRFAGPQLALHPLQMRWFLYAVPAGTGHYRPVPLCGATARAPYAPNRPVFIPSTGRYWPLLISTALRAYGPRSIRSK
jgi:hypothetical protein